MVTRHDLRRPTARAQLALLGSGLAVVTLLAACGGSDETSTASGGAGSTASEVSVRSVPDVGRVLVDSDGKTLYAEDTETSSELRCTDTCLGFWFPLTVKAGDAPSGSDAVAAKLDTVKRSDDGKTQVTFDGKPLYTFKLDTSAGMAKGDGFTDDFGGTTLDWHAATVDGASTDAPETGGSGGGGYGY
jgi:predicted lipoprotein with Yx(FWY)xxD motif